MERIKLPSPKPKKPVMPWREVSAVIRRYPAIYRHLDPPINWIEVVPLSPDVLDFEIRKNMRAIAVDCSGDIVLYCFRFTYFRLHNLIGRRWPVEKVVPRPGIALPGETIALMLDSLGPEADKVSLVFAFDLAEDSRRATIYTASAELFLREMVREHYEKKRVDRVPSTKVA